MKHIQNVKYLRLLVYASFIFSACGKAHYTFNQKYAAPALQEDVQVLRKVLEANHPSLYWYTPKDTIDTYFNRLETGITDSLTEIQFRNRVAAAVGKIRCGHTSVRFSKAYYATVRKHRFPMFPLYLKTWKDSMVVVQSVWPKDSVFTRGTIVTAINGWKNNALLDSMFQLISTDGYSDNYKSQVISGNFPAWYAVAFGQPTSFTIDYINTNGEQASTTIKAFVPVKDSTTNADSLLPKIIVSKKGPHWGNRKLALLDKRALYIDTIAHTAWMHLATFDGGRLRGFFRRSFKTLARLHIQHLAIDLRENGGGTVEKSVLLTKYLKDTAFKVGDTVAAVSRSFQYRQYIKPWWVYWFPMHFTAHRMADGRIHQRRLEQHYYSPKQKHHFNGQVYLVQGGYTFSAATMFEATLKGQKNVTLIGEETGGGYYGNSAMHLLNIQLPHSKLRIILPMYRLVMDKNRIKNGRGVMPDIPVYPSSQAIRKGIDPKMEEVKKCIKTNGTQAF